MLSAPNRTNMSADMRATTSEGEKRTALKLLHGWIATHGKAKAAKSESRTVKLKGA